MLRVEIVGSADTLSLKFEGRLTANDAEHARTLLSHRLHGIRLVVDLTEVTFIDSVGQEVLAFFGRFGAKFVAETSYTLDICERLNLCLARGGGSDANPSGRSSKNGRRRRFHPHRPENEHSETSA